jgi:hypothetical protein
MEADDELARLDGLIETEAKALVGMMFERILPLMVSKRLFELGKALPAGIPARARATERKPDEAAPEAEPAALAAPAPSVAPVAPVPAATAEPVAVPGAGVTEDAVETVDLGRNAAKWGMFEALAAGPEEGMSSRDLDPLSLDLGVSLSAVRDGRSALRIDGIAVFDRETKLWRLLPRYRGARPLGERPKADTPHDARLGTVERIVLAIMRKTPAVHLPLAEISGRPDLKGYTRISVQNALAELRNAGVVQAVKGEKWALTPKGLSQTTAERAAAKAGKPGDA